MQARAVLLEQLRQRRQARQVHRGVLKQHREPPSVHECKGRLFSLGV
jgi:hypothetical protein